MIASLVVAALVALGLVWWVAVRPVGGRAARTRDTPLPLFAIRSPGRGVPIVRHALAGAGVAPPPDGLAGWRDGRAPARSPAPARPLTPTGRPPVAPPDAERDDGRGVREPGSARASGAAVARPVSDGDGATVEHAQDHAEEHADGTAKWAPSAAPAAPGRTVQFLPGRLEVVQGRGLLGQELRFVRPERSGERAVVTFGRGEGAPYRHVQLKVPTVSRLHARLSLEAGSGTWMLENLSSTNPVAVNGVELHAGDAPRPLADGDRVEMGEVVFTYRAR